MADFFPHGTEVIKRTKHAFLQGWVVSTFRRRNGVVLCVVETKEQHLFVCEELDLAIMPKIHNSCRHDKGFVFHAQGSCWICRLGCGYQLNFDPSFFTESVAILDRPSGPPKLPPELKPSRF